MAWIKNTLELMLNPFFLILILLFLCVLLLRHNSHQIFVQRMLIFILFFILVLSTGWVPRALTKELESKYPIVEAIDSKIKWVVVLGGGHAETPGLPANDLLTGSSLKRFLEGVRLFRQLPNAKLLLSGGGETEEFSEAVLLQQLSQWLPISAARIVLETKSLNTEDQAQALRPILHQEPFYLVTSAIHMPRAMELCKQQGLNPIAAPTDFTFFWQDNNYPKMFVPNTYNLSYLNIALHELLGHYWIALKQNNAL